MRTTKKTPTGLSESLLAIFARALPFAGILLPFQGAEIVKKKKKL
jgi:hypothetical protein